MGDQIDRRGRAGSEHDLVARRGEEPRDLVPRAFIGRGRRLGQAMDAAMDVGALGGLEGVNRVQHCRRSLRRGAGIQVVEPGVGYQERELVLILTPAP